MAAAKQQFYAAYNQAARSAQAASPYRAAHAAPADANVDPGQAYPRAVPYVHEEIAAEPYVHVDVPAEPYVHQGGRRQQQQQQQQAYVQPAQPAQPAYQQQYNYQPAAPVQPTAAYQQAYNYQAPQPQYNNVSKDALSTPQNTFPKTMHSQQYINNNQYGGYQNAGACYNNKGESVECRTDFSENLAQYY